MSKMTCWHAITHHAVLAEAAIIVSGSCIDLVTLAVFALRHIVFPFVWPHTFVPFGPLYVTSRSHECLLQ